MNPSSPITPSTAFDNPDILVREVRKHFKEVKAVDGIDLEIRRGEFVALLGPNGAGKTTLVEMIEGIQKPDAGEIRIQGKTWQHHAGELRRILGISLQETFFFDKLTVSETLALFASFYGLPRERVGAIMDLVNLEEKRNAYVVNLSGGQRQRLALGIALLNNARILLLDEPTTGLDPSARREIWNILLKLKAESNTTLILTTHYMEEAEFLCDRIIIMDKGKVLAEGTLEQLLSRSNSSEIIEFAIAEERPQLDLNGLHGFQKFTWDGKLSQGRLLVDSIVARLPEFLELLERQRLTLRALECRKMTLDDLFISMTGRHLRQES